MESRQLQLHRDSSRTIWASRITSGSDGSYSSLIIPKLNRFDYYDDKIMGSPHWIILGDFGWFEVWESKPLIYFLTRPENFYLSDMSIFSAVLVLDNCQLNIYGANVVFFTAVQQLCFERHCEPSWRLFQFQILHFLQVLQIVTRPNRNFAWSIGFVTLEIQVERYFLNPGLLHELDVDQMGLGPIRLPEGVSVVISQLLYPIASFGRA